MTCRRCACQMDYDDELFCDDCLDALCSSCMEADVLEGFNECADCHALTRADREAWLTYAYDH